MASNNVESLLSNNLGNHRRRNDVLQVMSFPGLSVDNVGSTPSVSSGLSGAGSVDSQVASLSGQLVSLQSAQQSQLNQLLGSAPVQAGSRTSATTSSSGSGLLGNFASSFLSSGFGLSPIFEGLFSLFGGGSSQTTQNPLVPFSLPPSIQYAGALNPATGSVTAADYGQNGQLRTLSSGSGANSAQSSPNVQIQVNALDTQSILDRSDDIAQAVRQALLNNSSLNDVIANL